MTTMETHILSIAKNYLRDLSAGKSGEELAYYFSENVQQIEYPNQLNVKGGTSDLRTLLDRSEKAKHIIANQSNDIRHAYVSGNTVILEVIWTGVFNIAIGQTPPGNKLTAHFAVFLEFENGKITRQRNYDCFDPF